MTLTLHKFFNYTKKIMLKKLLEWFLFTFMHEVGFEPTQRMLPGLKSGSLDHSDIRALIDSFTTYQGRTPDVGLEPTTTRLKGVRSTD